MKLAIVGRPNVGKSALFNRICNRRIAIVDAAHGVTRDRLYAMVDFFGTPIELIDTGGIDPGSGALFQEEIRQQAEIAVAEADALIMVVDGIAGPTPLDKEVARILRRSGKPLTLAVNKIDVEAQVSHGGGFYALGIPRLVCVSALQGRQIAELLEVALERLPSTVAHIVSEVSSQTRVAIVGRPNVGKSTLLNHILGVDRCVVSPIPGTTRDSVDVRWNLETEAYTFVDTAGIRRKKAAQDVVDKFATIRTERSMEQADICILVLDAQEGITAQEKRIAQEVEQLGKGCIVVLNKWDLIHGFRMEHCLASLRRETHFLAHCPVLCVSAKTGRNVSAICSQIRNIAQGMQKRISTGQLNKFVERATQKCHPPMLQGKRLKIYYLTQVDVRPPQFVLFVNRTDLMTETYKKYLINHLRETHGFQGVPLHFFLRGREEKQVPDLAVPPSSSTIHL